MEEYQDPGRVAARRMRPFARNAIAVDCFERHIVCYRPNRPYLVETLTPLRPSNRSWFDPNKARMASISF
jgi:hypothetical protein